MGTCSNPLSTSAFGVTELDKCATSSSSSSSESVGFSSASFRTARDGGSGVELLEKLLLDFRLVSLVLRYYAYYDCGGSVVVVAVLEVDLSDINEFYFFNVVEPPAVSFIDLFSQSGRTAFYEVVLFGAAPTSSLCFFNGTIGGKTTLACDRFKKFFVRDFLSSSALNFFSTGGTYFGYDAFPVVKYYTDNFRFF